MMIDRSIDVYRFVYSIDLVLFLDFLLLIDHRSLASHSSIQGID